jgi:hypothetical protein
LLLLLFMIFFYLFLYDFQDTKKSLKIPQGVSRRNVLNAIFPHEDIYYLLVLLVEQELLTFTEHMSSPPVFSGVHVTRSLVLCVYFVDRCLLLVLSVLHRFTDSGYPFIKLSQTLILIYTQLIANLTL